MTLARPRWPWLVIGVLLVLLVVLRLALPSMLKSYVNERLAALPNHRGHVEDIDVSLWRGAYQLRGVEIRQLDTAVDEPLFTTPRMEISVLWSALADGVVVARIRAQAPKISFAAGHGGKAAQTGKGTDWAGLLDGLTPFRIDRFEVFDGQVHYYDFGASPKVDVHLDEVRATLSNLTNRHRDDQNQRVAELDLHALAMAQSNLDLNLRLDPYEKQPDFTLKLKLLGLKVTELREAMRAYTPFDPAQGTLDLVVEAHGEDGGVEGYIKPLFHDLKLVNWQRAAEHERNPFSLVFDAVGSVFNLAFQNQPKEQLATKVPFKGRLDAPDVDLLSAATNLLKNAFVTAFEPKFDKIAK